MTSLAQRVINKFSNKFGYEISRPKVYQDNDVAFLHIGKNAGTQIKHLSKQINSKQTVKTVIGHKHSTKLIHIPNHVPYFFSIRDPITRFKSGFYSRKRKGQPRLYVEWKAGEKVAFSAFAHANDLAEALFSEGELGEKAFWAMNNILHIRSQQIDWFERAGSFFIHREPIYIVRQENFREDFAVLLEKMGLEIDFDESQDPLNAHSYNYQDDPELSDLAKKNLRIWYARDIEFYEACVSWMKHSHQ